MSLVFQCQCGTQLTAQPNMIGQQVSCPHCSAIVIVPNPHIAPQVPPAFHGVPAPPPPMPPYGAPGAYRKPRGKFVPGTAITAGVLAIVLGVLHVGCGGFMGIGLLFMETAKSAMWVDSSVPGSANVNGAATGAISAIQLGMGLTVFLCFLFAAALITGAVGIFRRRMWGWILGIVTATISLLIGCLIGYGYYSSINAISTAERAQQEAYANFDIPDYPMQATANEGYKAAKRQIHIWYCSMLIMYLGYAGLAGGLLGNPSTFKAFR